MNDTYVECLVKQKSKTGLKILKYTAITLTVLVGLWSLMTGSITFLIVAVLLGVGAYFAHSYSEIEYEYLYVDREITIDRIIARSRRKKVVKLEVDKMEIFAPYNSHELDSYKARKLEVKDYSSGEEKQPDKRYALYYEGQKGYILEPSEEFVKAVANIAPRKVKSY